MNCDMSVVFSGPPVSSTYRTDHHDITETLLKVALSIIKTNQTNIIERSYIKLSSPLVLFYIKSDHYFDFRQIKYDTLTYIKKFKFDISNISKIPRTSIRFAFKFQ